MAIQTGKMKLTGRVGDIIYYKMDGKYYARAVSSLSGRRVKRDPAFKRTMEFAKLFGKASKMASELYRSLPVVSRNYKLYRKITGQANQMLKVGLDELTVALVLKQMFVKSKTKTSKQTIIQKPEGQRIKKHPVASAVVKTKKPAVSIAPVKAKKVSIC